MIRSASQSTESQRSNGGEAGDSASSVWCIAAIALLGARWLMPAEAPEQGSTLWIAVAWLIVALAWLWRCRRWETALYRWDRWDVLICTLAGGFMLSSAHVLIAGGQRRAALTMLWEWFALAVAMLLCRRWLREGAPRQAMLTGLASLTVALSVLGAWQHHVWYPKIGRMVTEYESLSSRSDLSSDERNRLRELQLELGPDIALLETSGRESFLNRVLNSAEPVGRFALANTFAAVLGFGLIVFAWLLVNRWRGDTSGFSTVCLIIVCCMLTYVILLTKSRSAWVGLGAGGAYALIVAMGQGGVRGRRWIVALIAILSLGVLFVATWLTGGLDRLVIAEAAKSLSYRGEFWRATLGVIAEDPWLGTGPGNFRQHYLKYKLPGSSEEILDPHNLCLEAWAVGGIVPLVSLVALLVGTIWVGVKQRQRSIESQRVDWRSAGVGVALAGIIPFAYKGMISAHWDIVLLLIAAGATVVLAIWRMSSGGRLTAALDHPVALMAALLALVMHLLAAGGTGMPGIVQLLLLMCVLLVDRPHRNNNPLPVLATASRRIYAIAMAGILAALVAAVSTGLIPVMNATSLIQAGDIDSLQRGSPTPMTSYSLASDADDLDPLPWNRRAEFLMGQWRLAESNRSRHFEQAVSAQREAIARDPRNSRLKFELGEWYWMAYREIGDADHLGDAMDWLEQATVGYPNSSQIQAKFSLVLDAAGDESAKEHAARAIELDDLNRVAGHTDKLLPADLRDEVERIAAESGLDAEGN